jgi:hypothetical protein
VGGVEERVFGVLLWVSQTASESQERKEFPDSLGIPSAWGLQQACLT